MPLSRIRKEAGAPTKHGTAPLSPLLRLNLKYKKIAKARRIHGGTPPYDEALYGPRTRVRR